ncbi:aminoglycoside adenylyltransferase domain-containing protein [Paenibacillus sp. GCM10012306]|uniref:aminoglycoside adenylyltransferase domain-containing protein n=1 Tax=Paenibacillus sp. GCM10012306 TaxID=3317342 RepID=UPI003616A8AF
MQVILDRIRALFVEELGDNNLVGVYLHGSLAMDCFNPAKSDIDVLIVVKETLSVLATQQISQRLLLLHDDIENSIECSIILEKFLTEFVYPTPCEYHFSDFHREQYRTNEHYLCGGYEDKDLASQIAVAYHRGRALYGSPLAECYPPIERQYYLASILYDIECASDEILDKPMYVTLNLCRVLYFIRKGAISSKKEGGIWGTENLPSKYHDLVQCYLEEYTRGSVNINIAPARLSEFAEYMLLEIQQELTGERKYKCPRV